MDDNGGGVRKQVIHATDLLKPMDIGFNLEEIRTLCFQVGVDFDKLAGEGKLGKIRELIKHCDSRKILDALYVACYNANPNMYWGSEIDSKVSQMTLKHMIPVLTSGTKQLAGMQMARFERRLDVQATCQRQIKTWVGVAIAVSLANSAGLFLLLAKGLFT